MYLPNHRKKHFRLTDNTQSGYAVAIKWEDVEEKLIDAIHQAWNNRKRPELIDNSRTLRERNAPLERKSYSTPQENDNCFIATAAYGTPLAYEIDILKKWRDHRLKNSLIGRWFINFYYKNSPPLADYIRTKRKLRLIIRGIIGLLIKIIR